MLDHIEKGLVPTGSTRRRREQARDGKADSTKARSSNRKSRAQHEVHEFLSRVGNLIKVQWTKFEDTTDEPVAALLTQ